jgi:hypothetical protein
MVTTDGDTFIAGQFVAELVKYVKGALSMATIVRTFGLAKVMEECHDGDTVSRKPPRMGKHVIIDFKGVLGKATPFLMVTVAATIEVRRCVQVVDDGFRAGTPEGAKDPNDPSSIVSVIHVPTPLYKNHANCVNFMQKFS